MIKIDRLSPPKGKGGRPAKYPWDQLRIGDSFLMEKSYSPYSLIRGYNKSSGKPPIFITSRKEGDSVRVYRIKAPIPFNPKKRKGRINKLKK